MPFAQYQTSSKEWGNYDAVEGARGGGHRVTYFANHFIYLAFDYNSTAPGRRDTTVCLCFRRPTISASGPLTPRTPRCGIQQYVNLFRSQRHVHQHERSWLLGHPRHTHSNGSYTTILPWSPPSIPWRARRRNPGETNREHLYLEIPGTCRTTLHENQQQSLPAAVQFAWQPKEGVLGLVRWLSCRGTSPQPRCDADTAGLRQEDPFSQSNISAVFCLVFRGSANNLVSHNQEKTAVSSLSDCAGTMSFLRDRVTPGDMRENERHGLLTSTAHSKTKAPSSHSEHHACM